MNCPFRQNKFSVLLIALIGLFYYLSVFCTQADDTPDSQPTKNNPLAYDISLVTETPNPSSPKSPVDDTHNTELNHDSRSYLRNLLSHSPRALSEYIKSHPSLTSIQAFALFDVLKQLDTQHKRNAFMELINAEGSIYRAIGFKLAVLLYSTEQDSKYLYSEALINGLYQETSVEASIEVMHALKLIGPEHLLTSDIRTDLMFKLSHSSKDIRLSALELLLMLPEESDTTRLATASLHSEDHETVISVLYALSNYPRTAPQLLSKLHQLCDSNVEQIRAQAIHLLNTE
ncbi:hypothetical protein [Alteromonas sp. KUL49]|uniref:hypothetical protein n=1 Tax=Alteromonas sp. KUL49 TaxID=2480798 RepID=UPI00102F11B5|nr:hypothetical protein [Alteromonas sp. KUL49]TAP42174.1 hypothetical protein EYS00_00670 [Alteromonas sp. KUL49]GEA09759.1 hypothetical protein KUL49_01340 [Alteromonas sp. KUL49]